MSTYTHITKFIPALEVASPDAADEILHQLFVPACYDPDITDHDYLHNLEYAGLMGDLFRHVNFEWLDLETTVACLTMLLRVDRANHGFGNTLMQAWYDGRLLRILRRIAEFDGTYERPRVVTFYGENDKDGYLSNWYGASFSFRSTTFPTSEHWMMWQKARVFGAWGIADEVLQTTDLDEVKGLGKKVSPYDDEVWDEVRRPIMRVGLRQKFSQNDRLMNDLLSTGSAVLAEAAPKDKVWGVGIGKGDPALEDPLNWHGRNLLGITLMEVRADLRSLCEFYNGSLSFERALYGSPLWRMNLLELSRMPQTRSVALMYAQIVRQANTSVYHSSRDVLGKVRDPLREINRMIAGGEGGLPVTGWHELLDELALQVMLGRF